MEIDKIKIILKYKIENANTISEIWTICDIGKEICYHSNMDDDN